MASGRAKQGPPSPSFDQAVGGDDEQRQKDIAGMGLRDNFPDILELNIPKS
jgi:hypothetical protein